MPKKALKETDLDNVKSESSTDTEVEVRVEEKKERIKVDFLTSIES